MTASAPPFLPMPERPILRIGTRGSKLALTQCGWVQRRIVAAMGYDPALAEAIAPLVVITTTGDRIQDRRLIEAGGKALFTKEIEAALLNGEVDIAVHSMKDMPADDVSGLALCAVPDREDPRDAFLSKTCARLNDLPQGARLGTASLRRQAQALAARPDLDIVMVRGNVDTRLSKLKAGEFDGLILAAAGLRRLGLQDEIKSLIDPVANPPAPAQGALGIQSRQADLGQAWMTKISNAADWILITAERGALSALEASCKTAVGAFARWEGLDLHLTVEALSGDGRKRWRREALIKSPDQGAAQALGEALGQEIRTEAGPELILAVS